MRHKSGILIALSGVVLASTGINGALVAERERIDLAPLDAVLVKDDLDGAVLLETIEEKSVVMVSNKVDDLISRGAKTVTIKINSDGGGVEEGNVLINFLEEKIKKGTHIRCIVDYRARSMAFTVLESPACQERLSTKRAMFLAHEPSVGVKGNRRMLRLAAEYLDALANNMAAIIGPRLKIGTEKYKEKVANGDWTFSYDEALEIGAIDGEISPDQIPYTYTVTLPVSPE